MDHAYDHRWELGLDHDLDLNLGHKELEQALFSSLTQLVGHPTLSSRNKSYLLWLATDSLTKEVVE